MSASALDNMAPIANYHGNMHHDGIPEEFAESESVTKSYQENSALVSDDGDSKVEDGVEEVSRVSQQTDDEHSGEASSGEEGSVEGDDEEFAGEQDDVVGGGDDEEEEEEEEEDDEEEEENEEEEEEGNLTVEEEPTMDEETEPSELSDGEEQHPSSSSETGLHEEDDEIKLKETAVLTEADGGVADETGTNIKLDDPETESNKATTEMGTDLTSPTTTAPFTTPITISPMVDKSTGAPTSDVTAPHKGTAPIGSLTAMANSMSKTGDQHSRTCFVKVSNKVPQISTLSSSTYNGSALKGFPYKILSSRDVTSSYQPRIITTYQQNSIDQMSTVAQANTELGNSGSFKQSGGIPSNEIQGQIDDVTNEASELVLPAVSGVIPDPMLMSPTPVHVDFSEQSRRQVTKAKRWGCGC